ncbi:MULTISPECIES: DoxX family protein [Streptomyces]|uniref:DoxX family protein n=1 Tax=Streptomyces TaxID=1883 RepID=UPI0027DB3D05|nr:DoxX family protein [Streptomyces sp. 9-7]
MVINPWWLFAGLAAVQLGDAALCLKPVEFVRACLEDVGFPHRYWRLLPVLKTASAAALIVGIWFLPLAVLTTASLVVYFLVAISLHVRAKDYGRNLFLNATGMLVLCTSALVVALQAV